MRYNLAAIRRQAVVLFCLAAGCGPADGSAGTEVRPPGTPSRDGAVPAPLVEPYEPAISPADFVARVDHPFFPLTPGTVFRYASTAGGETNVVTVTDQARSILGIAATVVLDQVFENGRLTEETRDWYAQDHAGNVWYLGEDSREMEGGRLVPATGSWEAGQDGARPGIIMEATPHVGDAYRQEYREGIAEDQGRVLALDVAVTVPFGSFTGCIRTLDTSRLEPGVKETKTYCRGVGLVLEEEGGVRNELTAVEHR